MNPVQYLILNKGAAMSTGKAAAQAAHASVEGVRLSAREPNGNPWDASIVNRWYRGGHYAKIVLEAADAEALRVAKEYIEARGFKTSLIIDEGRTELAPLTPTALGCEIVNKDDPHVSATFGVFDLYTDLGTRVQEMFGPAKVKLKVVLGKRAQLLTPEPRSEVSTLLDGVPEVHDGPEPRVLTEDVQEILHAVIKPGEDDGAAVAVIAARARVSPRTVYRCLNPAEIKPTISLDLADRLCVAAGTHPSATCRLVWPDGRITPFGQ